MNKKGFTLVELLATIVILGVLSPIGIASTSKYLTQSRKKSYKIMSQTVYEAAMNCITQGKCNAPTSAYGTVSISTAQLIDYGYLKKLDNPRRGKEDCSGTVTITNKNSNNSEYKKYEYSRASLYSTWAHPPITIHWHSRGFFICGSCPYITGV